MTTTKPYTDTELRNRIAISKLYRAIESDFISIRELEITCCTMFRMGTSAVASLRKYFRNCELDIEIVHTMVKSATQQLEPKKVRFNKRKPTLLVVNYENNGITRKVEIYYYAGCNIANESKFSGLKFWNFN